MQWDEGNHSALMLAMLKTAGRGRNERKVRTKTKPIEVVNKEFKIQDLQAFKFREIK